MQDRTIGSMVPHWILNNNRLFTICRVATWEGYVASNTQCKGASRNCVQRMTYAAGSTWKVEPTPASNSTDFVYVVTKPSIQLNRVCINGAVGDKILNEPWNSK